MHLQENCEGETATKVSLWYSEQVSSATINVRILIGKRVSAHQAITEYGDE